MRSNPGARDLTDHYKHSSSPSLGFCRGRGGHQLPTSLTHSATLLAAYPSPPLQARLQPQQLEPLPTMPPTAQGLTLVCRCPRVLHTAPLSIMVEVAPSASYASMALMKDRSEAAVADLVAVVMTSHAYAGHV